MKWTTRQAALEDVKALQERYSLGYIPARILSGRGVLTSSQVKFYLENDISFLHNPFLFEDMEIFCDRVLSAIETGEKVLIFGDRDADGITSTALLYSELKSMGLDVSWNIPMGDDPYGVTKDNIDKALSDGFTLAITVDCGISCIEEIDYAQQHGLDFLVTDHHIAGDSIPSSRALIDPKVEGCGYPFRDLAGCGVAAKCIWALRFAQTPYYKEEILLLHSFPGNGTVIIEAAKVENMVVTDRISEEVVPGVLPSENSKLLKFLCCGLPVFVFDKDTEMVQMNIAFPKAEINLTDLRPEFEKALPFIRGKSLFALNAISRFALYSNTKSELETFIGLFCAYLRASYPSIYKDYKKIMDLVAIGTVSDIMPMVDENRIIIKTGLKILAEGTRDSIRPFLAMQNLLGKTLSTTDISWQISPLLNASGRLGRPDVALKMILAEDQKDALEYASSLEKLNKERQKVGEDAWDRLLPKAKKSFEQFGSKMVLVRDDKLPRGITGILAARLQKNFHAPAIVITQTEDGRCVGSMRSSDNFNCHEFLSHYAEILDDFGGHACAGGFSASAAMAEELCLRISEDIDYMDCPEEEDENLLIDVNLSKEQFNSSIMKTVELFEPYGEQNGALIFEIQGARIESILAMANQKNDSSNHLRMTLEYGGYKWPSVFWSAGQRVGKDFDSGEIVDAVFRMGRNYYRNQETVQLTIMDIKRHS